MLAVLAAVIVVLLLAVVGGNIASPGKWSRDFHVLLGLDLTSGTTVALQAEAPHGKTPSPQNMKTAVNIMLNRVNAGGFTEASVVQQGNNIINVWVPGQSSQAVVKLVEQTAELLFRQVLLEAPNTTTPTPTPSPAATGSASPAASGSASPAASPSASTKAFVRGAGHSGGVAEMATGARSLRGDTATLTVAAKRSPTASASATPSASASATPSAATPTPSAPATAPASANGTTSWQQASATGGGNAALVTPQVRAEFNKLNCANPKWQQAIGYTPQIWNDPHRQIVSCGSINGQLIKFALDKSLVLGSQIHSANASLQQGSTFWQVNLNFNGAGTNAFGNLTSKMFGQYGKTQSPLDDLAVVLDGKVISFPRINGAIPGGQAQITGNFDQSSATSLANVLSYGALPLSFHQQSVESVTPQLGHDQLTAGLIAAGLGLLLVVIYLLFYYRGLAIVAVSSLIIAALLAWLSIIALGKSQHLALTLAGIAGLIVAIGITADSFVVFFERLRDEVR